MLVSRNVSPLVAPSPWATYRYQSALFGKSAYVKLHVFAVHRATASRTADCVQFLIIHVTLRANSFLYGNHFPKHYVTNFITWLMFSHVASPRLCDCLCFLEIWFPKKQFSIVYRPLSVVHRLCFSTCRCWYNDQPNFSTLFELQNLKYPVLLHENMRQ